MSEFLLDEDEDLQQWVTPDPEGFTLRTRFKNTQQALDQNAQERNGNPMSFKDKDGASWYKACSVPPEVMDLLFRRLGRMPTPEELIQFSQDRDFSKLRTTDARLTGKEGRHV